MRNRINIKDFENFLQNYKDIDERCLCDHINVGNLATEITAFLNGRQITYGKVDSYEIYQIEEDFEEIEPFWENDVDTNDIEMTLDEFCQEMGDHYRYNINDLTCYNNYGTTYKFVKKGERP